MRSTVAALFVIVLLAGCGGSTSSPIPAKPSLSLPSADGTPVVPSATVYIAGTGVTHSASGSPSLYGWPVGSGDEAPTRTVYGPATLPPNVTGVAVDGAGNVYALYSTGPGASGGSIVEFPPNPNGTPTPIRVISGPHTRLGQTQALAVAPDGTIFVLTTPYSANCNYTMAINVYSPTANGDVAPQRQLTNALISQGGFGTLAADGTDTVFESIPYLPAVLAFGPEQNGSSAPDRTISGSNTGMLSGGDITLAVSPQLARIAVYTSGHVGIGAITEYPTTANGNVAPTNTINPAPTGYAPFALAFDSTGNLYATTTGNPSAHSVLVYSPTASGNATPLTTFIPDVGGYTPPGLDGYLAVAP